MMDHKRFQVWLAEADDLSKPQCKGAKAVFSGGSKASASLAVIEAGEGENRRCPRCSTLDAVSHGHANKPGPSFEQRPVLVAAGHSGMTVNAILPTANTDALREVIEPVIDEDVGLVRTTIEHVRHSRPQWAFGTRCSTQPEGSGFGTPFTSTRSTADIAS